MEMYDAEDASGEKLGKFSEKACIFESFLIDVIEELLKKGSCLEIKHFAEHNKELGSVYRQLISCKTIYL